MGKSLNEMSLTELWELFPIVLTPHQRQWQEWYKEESGCLENLSSFGPVRISHIGSTAISSIWAKPIVDILVEIIDDMQSVKAAIEKKGYICMSETEGRVSFNKGYTKSGFAEKVFHLHLRFAGDNDELYFRDYLIAHPDIAYKYEELKQRLWRKYEHDRDAYTERKSEFIRKYTKIAKETYGEKY